jgi:hypothetical protein
VTIQGRPMPRGRPLVPIPVRLELLGLELLGLELLGLELLGLELLGLGLLSGPKVRYRQTVRKRVVTV